MSFRVILSLHFFSFFRPILCGCPLGPRAVYTSIRYELHPVEWVLGHISNWLVTELGF